jgi:large subunit ribosomal protein L10
MKKEVKAQIIESLKKQVAENPNFYVVDLEGLDSEATVDVRRACFKSDIKLVVVKNTLFKKVLEATNDPEAEKLIPTLEGTSAIMFTSTPNGPAKLIKDFEKTTGKPALKGALVQDCAYVGKEYLDTLVNIKSREELIGDIIALLQSPVKNVVSALQASAGGKIGGIVKTLSEKEENK